MTVLGNLDGLPDFRLRAINKMLIKNFINKCPVPFFPTVMIPILKQVSFFLPVLYPGFHMAEVKMFYANFDVFCEKE